MQFYRELCLGEADLPKYLTDKGTGEIPSWMVGERGRSAVRMAIEDVRPLLPNGLKAQI